MFIDAPPRPYWLGVAHGPVRREVVEDLA